MYFISATAGEVFTYIGYVIVAVLALMAMIVIHELGHYTAGKLLGFKIDEFAIGFGPAIIKKRNKKTGELFTLRPFPSAVFALFTVRTPTGQCWTRTEIKSKTKTEISSKIPTLSTIKSRGNA